MFFKYNSNTFCILNGSCDIFKDILESIPDYRKIVLVNDKNLLKEIGFSKNDINHLSSEFKNILIEQHENYLEYVKDQKESVIEKILNKWMENGMTFLNK